MYESPDVPIERTTQIPRRIAESLMDISVSKMDPVIRPNVPFRERGIIPYGALLRRSSSYQQCSERAYQYICLDTINVVICSRVEIIKRLHTR